MVILLLACTSAGPTTSDTGPPPDTADTDSGGDTADTAVDPAEVDADGDGFTPKSGDCDDARPNVYPGAPDYCDGLDADCDGEAIPDGSCSAVGDASAQWSWWIQSGDLEPRGVQFGAVSGGDTPDLVPDAYGEDGSSVEIVVEPSRLATRPPISTWGLPSWTSDYPRYAGVIALPIADVTGDALGDILLTADSTLGFQGGVFLIPGSTDAFPTEPVPYDQGARAYWLDGDGLELDEAIDGSVGDVTGDGLADVLVRTVDRTHDHLTLVPGDAEVSGEHGFAELPSMWTDEDETDIFHARMVGDLDGDGFAEVLLPAHATDRDSFVYYLSGADWAEDGHIQSNVSALEAGEQDDGIAAGTPDMPSEPGDINGDGLDDDLIWRTGGDSALCASVVSGGIPTGALADWTVVEVCGKDSGPHMWISDIDGDGSRDFVTWTGLIVPSAPLAAGGTFDIADLRTLRHDYYQHLEAITDLNADGLAEWIFRDAYDNNQIYILAGFEIPWEDDSKW